jgi:hypothetical protein
MGDNGFFRAKTEKSGELFSTHLVTRKVSSEAILQSKWSVTKSEIEKYIGFTSLNLNEDLTLDYLYTLKNQSNHPLLDFRVIVFNVSNYSPISDSGFTRDHFTNVLPFSMSLLFDYTWYASLLYDQGYRIPEDLYSHWLQYGLPAGLSVFTERKDLKTSSTPFNLSLKYYFRKLQKWESVIEHFRLTANLGSIENYDRLLKSV